MAPRTAARVTRRSRLPRLRAPKLVPADPLHGSRDDMVRAMADMLFLENPRSATEALKTLRLAYPDCPLALRLAALAAAMRRPLADPNGI